MLPDARTDGCKHGLNVILYPALVCMTPEGDNNFKKMRHLLYISRSKFKVAPKVFVIKEATIEHEFIFINS